MMYSSYANTKTKRRRSKRRGLHITGVRGEHHIRLDAVADIEQLHGKKDIIFVVTKAYDMPDATKRALPF